MSIKIPDDYPNKPPKFTMVTKIYHMNISNTGGICLDSIASNWVPTCTIAGALVSIIALLTDPNPNSPNGQSEMANLYRSDKAAHDNKVREFVRQYAQM